MSAADDAGWRWATNHRGDAGPRRCRRVAGARTTAMSEDWSPVAEGRLVTGDNLGAIHVTEPAKRLAAGSAVDKNAP